MDIISFNEAATANGRIEKFIANPDSNSGIVTVPKTIASGESVTVPTGRVAVLPNTQVDGEIVVEAGAEIFVPAGSSVDFSNGIKVNGEKLTMSIPTAYHIYNGSVEATNTEITNGFSTTLYTGNGATQSINTGVDMATQWGDDASETFGGLVWLKSRSLAADHSIYDTIRGANVSIASNITNAQVTNTDRMNSFNSNGFTVGTNGFNTSSATYVSWNFQTTHRISGVTNHGKPYTCHYNPFTGFTIIKYEGSGIAGHEIPHSLGRKLGLIYNKNLQTADWWISQSNNRNGYLNNANAFVDSGVIDDNYTDKIVLTFAGGGSNGSGNQHILYGWANSYLDESNKLIGNYEIGVYQGTGVAGNKVKTRGKPAWVMIKRLDGVGNWRIFDNQRPYTLFPSTSSAEINESNKPTLNEDGFMVNTTDAENNTSGGQYLYMVVYDNDSGSGKSKYPKATDTTNLSINALVPYANGIDVNGSKVSIEYKNETITGLTLTEGKNYIYSKNDGTYGVNKYEPMYGSIRNRVIAGENPDYFDLKTMKWYETACGELVTNGTFDTDTSGWVKRYGDETVTVSSGKVSVTRSTPGGYISQEIQTTIGKTYVCEGEVVSSSDGNTGNIIFGNIETTYGQGFKRVIFTATSTTTHVKLYTSWSAGTTATFDNISVFEVEPTIGAEITPRTYLDCIVHADHNGQVSYVEELPKTTHITDLKVTDGFDLGQTWQDVTASRSFGVTYTNTTGKPIFVALRNGVSGTGYAYIYVNEMAVSLAGTTDGAGIPITSYAIVPNNSTYRFLIQGSSNWAAYELR